VIHRHTKEERESGGGARLPYTQCVCVYAPPTNREKAKFTVPAVFSCSPTLVTTRPACEKILRAISFISVCEKHLLRCKKFKRPPPQ